jgi:hypothetical protein
MSWWKKFKHAVSHAVTHEAHTVEHAVVHAAKTVVHKTENAAKTVVHAATKTADDVAKEATAISGAVDNETSELAAALVKAGVAGTRDVATGANWAAKTFEKGAEDVGTGLVDAGKYVSENKCSIAVGSALGIVVAAGSADGEEEGIMAAVAVAEKAGGIIAVQVAATAASAVITDALWEVPEVSDSGISKPLAKSVIKYAMVMAAKQSSSEVILSGGQFLTGVVLTTLTGFICSGEAPQGFKEWEALEKNA